MPLTIALILTAVASAYVCRTIANERHASARFWIWMGFIFGPFAIPFVFFQGLSLFQRRPQSS